MAYEYKALVSGFSAYLTYKSNHGWNPWIIFQIWPNHLCLIQIWSLLWAGGLCLWLFLSTFCWVATHIALKFSFHFLPTPHHLSKGQWNLNGVWDGDVKICLEYPNIVTVHFLHTSHIFRWIKMEQGWVKFPNRIITEAISFQFMYFLFLKKKKEKKEKKARELLSLRHKLQTAAVKLKKTERRSAAY